MREGLLAKMDIPNDRADHPISRRMDVTVSVVIGRLLRCTASQLVGLTERITDMVTLRFERDDGLAFLRGLSPFSDCTSYELRRVRSQMTSIERDAGEVLIEEGKPGSEFFVIASGSASVWRNGRLLDHLLAGSFFGELSLLDGKCRSATVRAESSIHLLAMSRREIQHAQQLDSLHRPPDTGRARRATSKSRRGR